MVLRGLCLVLALALALACCGVKSSMLDLPGGALPDKMRPDPSKPPRPLGEPGGTAPPYQTSP
jgi:hypothetical protein